MSSSKINIVPSSKDEILSKYDNIIKTILYQQCSLLLLKFKTLYKISNDNYNKELKNLKLEIDNLNIKLVLKKHIKTPKQKKKVKPTDRCQARTFNYFKILTLKNDKITYGTRCSRSKFKHPQYCYQHIENLPHGNYLEPESNYIKQHFIKEYKLFVKKEKPKTIIKTTNLINSKKTNHHINKHK